MTFNRRGKLTGDQRAILQLASEGGTYQSISTTLGISVTMTRGRLTWAFKKLGARSMAHAVALAVVRGDIPGPLVCDGHE